jgi:methylglyoxal synthase
MRGRLRLALVAHDRCKQDLLEWARWNRLALSRFELLATHNTGELVARDTGLPVRLLLSGEMGGDAQIAALVAHGEIDVVLFFWDPLSTQAHAADVRSLIRLAVLHDIPIACNRKTADLVISSPLLGELARAS